MKKGFLALSLSTALASSAFASKVDFKEGWNLVGFPLFQKTEVSQVLPLNKVEIIYSYSSNWNDKVTHLQPHKGYWVKAKEDFEIEDLTDKAIETIMSLTGKTQLLEDTKTSDSWNF